MNVSVRRSPFRVALAAAVVGVSLAGCSGTDDPGEFAGGDPGSTADVAGAQIIDIEEPSVLDQYESGDLTFADPADAGFEPVAEEPGLDPDNEVVAAPVIDPPDEALNRVPVVNPDAVEVLSRVDPIDKAPEPGEVPSDRDGRQRNEVGELVTIDDKAALACGNVEIAATALDDGDADVFDAALTRAIDAAVGSKTDGIAGWADLLLTLDATDPDTNVLIGFLRACSDGGYEL